VCLTIKVSSVDLDPDRLVAIAKAWPADRMPFHVDGKGWLRRRPIGFALHACDLLNDQADWNGETWAMQPEALPKLADAFAWLLDEIDGEVTAEALWDGDRATSETTTSRAGFLDIVRAGALGTKTRYAIER
jgi:hypothetical protein